MKKNKSFEAGFTLLELLVVISIIGLLASIILVNLTNARKRSRDVRRIADIRVLQTAIEDYYGKNGKYPTDLGVLVTDGFLPAEPKDPLATVGCAGRSDTCRYYLAVYTPPSTVGPQSYHLGTSFEDNNAVLLNQDRDCNSVTGVGCPFVQPYTNGIAPFETGFNGTGETATPPAGCGGVAGRFCYDIAQ